MKIKRKKYFPVIYHDLFKNRVKAGFHVDTGVTVAVKILKRENIIECGMTDQLRNEVVLFLYCCNFFQNQTIN